MKQTPYDVSAYELNKKVDVSLRKWSKREYEQERKLRQDEEMKREELHVYYYRIGHTLAFPLPLQQLPPIKQFPKGIPNIKEYPWYIWLLWDLRERWDALLSAWLQQHDDAAKKMWKEEVLNASKWSHISGDTGQAQLCTGHLACYLAEALHQSCWEPEEREELIQAASSLLEKDLIPYVKQVWFAEETTTLTQLHNIKLIILIGTTHLAEMTKHPMSSSLVQKLLHATDVWAQGVKDKYYSEGIAYEGFWLDPLLTWMELLGHWPDRDHSLYEVLKNFVHSCLHLSLPGRIDLSVPFGDSEAEMMFWMNVIIRIAIHTNNEEAHWLIRHFPPSRLTTSALSLRIDQLEENVELNDVPVHGSSEHPQAVSLRTGWDADDILVGVSASRYPQNHLHLDGGHIVIGTQGRFWITDPGYQQYRDGEERQFTLDDGSHNAPIINGSPQTKYGTKLTSLTNHAVSFDLSSCYEDAGVTVERHIQLDGDEQRTIVKDQIQFSSPPGKIQYTWLGGTYLAWAFVDGWGRLSDGKHTLWIAHIYEDELIPIQGDSLFKHAGSRGGLSLRCSLQVETTTPCIRWVFHFQKKVEWNPPTLPSLND